MTNANTMTWTRTIVLFVALLNQLLVTFNKSPLPIDDDAIATIVTVLAGLWAWWKNNSFTKSAIEADTVRKLTQKTAFDLAEPQVDVTGKFNEDDSLNSVAEQAVANSDYLNLPTNESKKRTAVAYVNENIGELNNAVTDEQVDSMVEEAYNASRQ